MIWIYAGKGGYEPDSQQTIEPTRDLTLHDILRIPVGGSVRVTVGPNDPAIYVFDQNQGLEYDYRTRIVFVAAAVSSGVELRLVADDGGGSEFVVAGNACCAGSHAVLNMTAGSEIAVQIRSASSVTRTFTLSSSRVDAP